jgi:cytochrome c5
MRDKIATTADAPPPLADPDSAEQPTNYTTPLPTDITTQQTSTQPDKPAPFQVAPPVTQAPTMADLQTRAMTAIGNACVVCHKQGTEKGGVTLVNAENQWAPSKDGAQLSNEAIVRSVETGRMPKLNATLHNQPLESTAKNDLLAWLRRQYAAR